MTLKEKLTEAYRYVDEKYVFNEHVYPTFGKLNEEEREIFIIKHTLLHIQKNLWELTGGVRTQAQMKCSESSKGRLKWTLVEILINFLKIAQVFRISADGFYPISEFEKESPFVSLQAELEMIGEEFFKHLLILAAECDKADHHGAWDETGTRARQNVIFDIYSLIVLFTNGKLSPVSLGEMLDLVPEYMYTKELTA